MQPLGDILNTWVTFRNSVTIYFFFKILKAVFLVLYFKLFAPKKKTKQNSVTDN